MDKKSLEVMEQFKKAFFELSEQVERDETMDYALFIENKNPFQVDFEELCQEVKQWIDEGYQLVNKLEE